jgi:hypothetical protein
METSFSVDLDFFLDFLLAGFGEACCGLVRYEASRWERESTFSITTSAGFWRGGGETSLSDSLEVSLEEETIAH